MLFERRWRWRHEAVKQTGSSFTVDVEVVSVGERLDKRVPILRVVRDVAAKNGCVLLVEASFLVVFCGWYVEGKLFATPRNKRMFW